MCPTEVGSHHLGVEDYRDHISIGASVSMEAGGVDVENCILIQLLSGSDL